MKTSQSSLVLLIAATAAFSISLALGTLQPAAAEDKAPPPPYLMTEVNGVVISVIWDEADIRKALPKGVKPVSDMSGGIVIYETGKSYGFGPYSSTYFYVTVEGYDAPDGTKGSWMLQGAYGPHQQVAQALKEYYSLPVRTGGAKVAQTGDIRHYAGLVGDQTIVTAEVKGGACEAVQSLEHYPALKADTGEIMLLSIPEMGDWCSAELKSFDLKPPAGDPFSEFKVKSVTSAGEFRRWSDAFQPPQNLGKAKP